MQRLPQKQELWWITCGKETVLKIVKDLGVGDLVVLQDYKQKTHIHTVQWSNLIDPVKATPTFIQKIMKYK